MLIIKSTQTFHIMYCRFVLSICYSVYQKFQSDFLFDQRWQQFYFRYYQLKLYNDQIQNLDVLRIVFHCNLTILNCLFGRTKNLVIETT